MEKEKTVKNKGGRPATGRRDNYVCLPLNDYEKKILVSHTKALDTSVSTLMRSLIFQNLSEKKE